MQGNTKRTIIPKKNESDTSHASSIHNRLEDGIECYAYLIVY